MMNEQLGENLLENKGKQKFFEIYQEKSSAEYVDEFLFIIEIKTHCYRAKLKFQLTISNLDIIKSKVPKWLHKSQDY